MNNKHWNIVFGIWNGDKLFQSLGPNLSTHAVKHCRASSSNHYWRLKLAFSGNTKEFSNQPANRWTAGPSNTSVSSTVPPTSDYTGTWGCIYFAYSPQPPVSKMTNATPGLDGWLEPILAARTHFAEKCCFCFFFNHFICEKQKIATTPTKRTK